MLGSATARFTRDMAAASTSTTDTGTPKPLQEQETLLDVSVLKELARKALVDALNSVRRAQISI